MRKRILTLLTITLLLALLSITSITSGTAHAASVHSASHLTHSTSVKVAASEKPNVTGPVSCADSGAYLLEFAGGSFACYTGTGLASIPNVVYVHNGSSQILTFDFSNLLVGVVLVPGEGYTLPNPGTLLGVINGAVP